MFENFAIGKHEYEEFISSLQSLPAVTKVAHDPNWKEATIYFDPDKFRAFGSLPDGVWILDTQIEEHEGHERIKVLIDTSDWLDGKADAFADGPDKGGYSDELMAFVKLQVDLVNGVRFSRLIRNNDNELRLAVYLEEPTTGMLDEILTWLGCAYSSVAYASDDGLLAMVEHRKDGTSYSPETVDGLRMKKMEGYLEEQLENSEPIQLPCGHESAPGKVFLSRPPSSADIESKGEVISFHGFEYIKLGLSEESVLGWKLQKDTESDSSTVAMESKYGFICEDCSIGYFPIKQNAFLWDRERPVPEKAVVSYDGGESRFMRFPISYTPT